MRKTKIEPAEARAGRGGREAEGGKGEEGSRKLEPVSFFMGVVPIWVPSQGPCIVVNVRKSTAARDAG